MGGFSALRAPHWLSTSVGAALAVVAGLLLLGYFSGMAGAGRGGREVLVPVASLDIESGAVISGDMLDSREVPESYVVPGSISGAVDIVGKRATRFIGRGEPFTAAAVGDRGPGALAARIPPGFRAYSIQLSGGTGALPSLRPGDAVDLIYTSFDPPGTRTLLHQKTVLAAGGPGEPAGDEHAGTDRLTVLVSPGEAELLAQASIEGELSVSLCPAPAGDEG